MTWRRAAAALAAFATTALVAPSGAAAITIESLSTQPSSTQAGSHPNFTLSMNFGGGSTPKSMRIDLPPGFVGNPNAAAKCPIATFEAGGCGTDSIVGSTTVRTAAGLPGGGGGGGGSPLDPLDPILDPVLQPVCTIPLPLLPEICTLVGAGSRSATTRARARSASRATARATQRQALELPLTVPGTI